MEKKHSEKGGAKYGLELVEAAASRRMVECLDKSDVESAQQWNSIAEVVRTAMVAQLLDAAEYGDITTAAEVAVALRGCGIL